MSIVSSLNLFSFSDGGFWSKHLVRCQHRAARFFGLVWERRGNCRPPLCFRSSAQLGQHHPAAGTWGHHTSDVKTALYPSSEAAVTSRHWLPDWTDCPGSLWPNNHLHVSREEEQYSCCIPMLSFPCNWGSDEEESDPSPRLPLSCTNHFDCVSEVEVWLNFVTFNFCPPHRTLWAAPWIKPLWQKSQHGCNPRSPTVHRY